MVGRHGAMKPDGRACGRGGMPATLRRPPVRVERDEQGIDKNLADRARKACG